MGVGAGGVANFVYTTNAIAKGVAAVINAGRSVIANLFDPRWELFSSGEQGLWYDLNDDTTIFQDSAGTTLASWGDPVGRVLDKSKGLENLLLYTSNFSAGVDSFTSFQGVAAGNIDGIGGESDWLRLTLDTANANHFLQRDNLFEIGRTYTITYKYFIPAGQTVVTSIRAFNSGSISIGSIKSVTGTTTTVTDTFTAVAVSLRFYAANGSALVIQDAGGDDVIYVKDVTVRTIAGNHAIQSTAGSRPIRGRMPKRGRVNLLAATQRFDDAYWNKTGTGTGSAPVVTANDAIAPDGTLTADRVDFNRGAGNTGADDSILRRQAIAVTSATVHNGSFYAKAATGLDVGKQIAFRHVAGGSYLVITLTADWQRVDRAETSFAASVDYQIAARGTITVDNTVSAHLWGAQLETGSTATTYQHVIDSLGFNVTEVGQPSCGYLSFNGSNQWMQTAASVNFSATDEMSVFAGVLKRSIAGVIGIVSEHTVSAAANNGGFYVAAPGAVFSSTENYSFLTRGTTNFTGFDAVTFTPPHYSVLSSVMDNGAATRALQVLPRVNGAVPTLNAGGAASTGAGNFANAVTYFGARGGTSLFFNGLMFSTIIRGALTSGTLLTRTEQYVARQTPTVNL